MKFKTIYEGEKAILIDRNGEKSLIEGPQRIFLFMKKFEKLQLFVANERQYLIVKFNNGHVEHKKGPVKEWLNRFEHESITIKEMFKLNSSELLVVYNRDAGSKEVNRRMCGGPCFFMPKSTEWLHTFIWHDQDSNEIGHVVPNARIFQDLTNKPDFFHYFVKGVRTLDDTLLTIKLMMIYELEDFEKMLDKTQDPISDFINAICADVVGYIAKLTFSEFLLTGINKLNQIDTYGQLKQRIQRIGFKINAIIYNGYETSGTLQDIQDNAIQTRTRMKLDSELDEQKNQLIDLRLKSQNECLNLEAELNKLKFEFEQKMILKKAHFDLSMLQKNHQIELQLKELEQSKSKEFNKKKNEIDEHRLQMLENLGIDTNQLEIETAKSRNKIDKIYKLIE